MKLGEVAKIIVGQIMTRVSAENKNEDDTIGIVKVLAPKAISDGIIVKEDLGELQICKMIDEKNLQKRVMWLLSYQHHMMQHMLQKKMKD